MSFVRRCAFVLLLCFALANAVLPLYEGQSITPKPPIGTTLQAIFGSHTSCPWKNLIRCANKFTVRTSTNGYVDPSKVTLRSEDGFPQGLESNWVAKTALSSSIAGHYRKGSYQVEFQGTGTVFVAGDATPQSSTTSPFSFSVPATSETGITLFINASDATAPVHGLKVIHADLLPEGDGWDPQFVNLIKKFSVVRLSLWQQEYYSTYGDTSLYGWASRPSAAHYTQAQEKGVAHEFMSQLGSLGLDLWLAIPYRANEDYIKNMAKHYHAALPAGKKLYFEESNAIGYREDQSGRIARYKTIRKALEESIPVSRFELMLSCARLCDEYTPYLNPNSSSYDKDFRKTIDAVSVPGTVLVGEEEWSEIKPNPFFLRYEGYTHDARRIAWERIIRNEMQYHRYIAKFALFDLPVYASSGSVMMAAALYGTRFHEPNTTMADIEGQIEASCWKVELAQNQTILNDLWAEWLERWYRIGGKMFVAGHLYAQGFQCAGHSTFVELANRENCNYPGLTRYIDSAATAPKLQAVLSWIAGTSNAKQLLTTPAVEGAYTCSGSCVHGECDGSGLCVCHAGYKGAACDQFDETLLPNRCMPEDYGVNLNGASDWSPVWIWSNFMNFAREWIHQPINQEDPEDQWLWAYAKGERPRPELDSNGYPKKLKTNEAMCTFMRRDTYEYPHGKYHVFYDGDGTLTFGMDTEVVYPVRNGYILVEVKPKRQLNNGLFLKVERTNPDDPIRNIKVIPDGVLSLYRREVFHPLFLESMKRYRVIRFMNLQNVGTDDVMNSTTSVRAWADRTPPTYYSQVAGRDGISIENVVALCNKLHIRPWINIPFNANDDYVRQQAQYVKANLNSKLQPIIEYSNEVWATHHYVGFYAADMGIAAGLSDGKSAVESRNCWSQHRARQIFAIYASEGVSIFRVAGAQSAWTGNGEALLKCAGAHTNEFDALAIAPYFGVPLTTSTRIASVDEVFDMINGAINSSAASVTKHMELGAKYGVNKVVTYEAGPAFFGGANAEDPDVVEFGQKIHRHERMKDAVKKYFEALRAAGSTINTYFTAPAGAWGKYGAWGIREFQNQDPLTTPKVAGFEAYAAAHTSCTPLPDPDPASCPSSCNGHGFCLPSGKCECYVSWRGDACEQSYRIPDTTQCNSYTCKQKGGNCSITSAEDWYDFYTCVGCDEGWAGWHCQFPMCENNCSFAGICSEPGKCNCYRGRTGKNCEIDCGCGGHGVCGSNNQCACDTGYKKDATGKCIPSCSCATCLAPNVCGCGVTGCLWGACWDGKCQCWDGFEGDRCEKLSATATDNADSTMGINVAGIADWTSTFEFLNFMWRSRDWFLNPAGVFAPSTRWTVNEKLELTEEGYPKFIPHDRKAGTFAMRDTHSWIPGGKYTLLYEGHGHIEVGMDAKVIEETRAVGFMEVQFTPTTVLNNGFFLQISYTDPSNPIRNIRIYPPNHPYHGYAREYIFHPEYFSDLKPFSAIRFMNWVNLGRPGSPGRSWGNRTTRRTASMTAGYGVAEENMIMLCNWLKADPWFSIPHDADDEYVENFAKMIRKWLRPDVAIHIEHSNEVWNGDFESFQYASKKGLEKWPEVTSKYDAAAMWHGFRSQRIFSIFERVFGPLQRLRLKFKLGVHTAGGLWRAKMSLQQITSRPLDVAVTTYFCGETSLGGSAAAMAKSQSELVAECKATSLANESYTGIKQFAAWCRQEGLGLTSYEGGPGLVQYDVMFGGYPKPGTEELYRSVHYSGEMRQIVKNFFDRQKEAGVGLNMYFTSASRGSRYGHWGIKESTMTKCSNSPKCVGTLEWIEANPNTAARRITWGLAEFGFSNVLEVKYAGAVTDAEMAALKAKLESEVPNSEITITFPSTTATARKRRGMMAEEATTVYVIIGEKKRGSTDTILQLAKSTETLFATASQATVAAAVTSKSVFVPQTLILPNVTRAEDVQQEEEAAAMGTGGVGSSSDPSSTPTPTSNGDEDNSLCDGTCIVIVGTVVGICTLLAVVTVSLVVCRKRQPTATDEKATPQSEAPTKEV